MNNRVNNLVKRGYSKTKLLELINYTKEDFSELEQIAFKHISRNCSPVENPVAIFVGGQPGSGKSSVCLKAKSTIGNIVEIGIDNFRMYHPKYRKIENYIKDFWQGKNETENDCPGNDMAEMTNDFAGAMSDMLLKYAVKKRYNVLLDWGMREPMAPLKTLNMLKHNNYRSKVLFIATSKEQSYLSCNSRKKIQFNSSHIIRTVTKTFHDYCIISLPGSINMIYNVGKEQNLFKEFSIINRDNKIIWKNDFAESPGEIFKKYLECKK